MTSFWGEAISNALAQNAQRRKENTQRLKAGRAGVDIPEGGFPGHSRTKNITDLGLLKNLFNPFLASDILTTPTNVPIRGSGQPSPDALPFNSNSAAGAATGQQNPNDIISLLSQLATGGQNPIDMSSLEAQARNAASAQFDPQIAAIQRAMSSAQDRANTNKTELGNMFNALSTSLKGDVPVLNQTFAQGNQDISNQFKQLQNQISQQYADVNTQEQQLMQRLNLQAASPDVLAQQNSDQALVQSQQAQSKQDTLDALKLLQTGAVNFSNQGADIANIEGTQRQSDLMTELEQYLQGASGQISDLQGAKQNSYLSTLADLTNQSQQGQNQQNQQLFDRLLEIAKLQQSMQQQQPTTQAKQGPLAASQFLSENSPENASALNSFLLQVLQEPQFTTGQMGPSGFLGGDSTKLTPEAAAQIAQQQAASQGMSPEAQQQIYLAMLAYYGRLY